MAHITPKQYLEIEDQQIKIIAATYETIKIVRNFAELCPLPEKLRPAGPKDIFEKAVIWYPPTADSPNATWSIVEEVLAPKSSFKAYCADDGCRYGLDGAYIEEE